MRWWAVCTVALAAAPASAQEIHGGVSAGGILAGTSSRLAVSPHVGLMWQTNSGFVFGLQAMCSVLPAMNGLGLGVYNHASLLVGYGSKTMQIGVGPSLSFYSMPMCGLEWCAPATGTAIGGSGRTYLHLAGPLGLSATVSVEYVNNPVLPGGATMMATAGPVLGWREKLKMVLAAIFVLSAGCGYIDGACWARTDDGQGSGAGAGPVVPGGVDGYGDSYAEPQNLDRDGDMPEECWVEACRDKCDRLREEDLHGCQKIPAEKQDGCRQRAKERAAECHKACDDDPIERCKRGCDKVYNACMDRCKDGPCRDQCFKDYVNCLRDCER